MPAMSEVTGERPGGGLDGVIAAAGENGRKAGALPPVHLWHPEHCGEIDIQIARDGAWFHDGAPIQRQALVRLFSTVLRLDPDGFHLVTPVEKLRIRVDDAPFTAVRVDRVGERLRFTTNVGDEVDAGPDHPLRMEPGGGGAVAPYLHVRRGLMARLTRPVFYELVDLAEPDPAHPGEIGVRSGGAWFALGSAEPA